MDDLEFKNAEIQTPHSIEAEKSVISCILQNNDLIESVNATITYEMFYDNIYRAMYKSILELWNTGFVIDNITLKSQTEPKANEQVVSFVDKIGSIRKRVVENGFDGSILTDEFFAELIDYVTITANVLDYCNIIKNKYVARQSIKLCEEVIINCRLGQEDIKNILVDAQAKLFDYAKTSDQKDYFRIDENVINVLYKIQEAGKTKDGITGVKTGYKLLDSRTAGFQKGNMIVLAARPGMGKTAFSLNLATRMSKYYNYNVLYFSLEMNRDELLMRTIAMETGISGTTLRSGKLNDSQWIELINAVQRIRGTNIYIDDNSYLTISEFRNKCLKLNNDLVQQGKKLDIVMIDYLQLMHAGVGFRNSGGVRGFNNRQEEVAEISRNIKALAKELEIPIIALSQLGREAEKSKRPQLSDLRESGAIEQDADIVMLIHSDRNNPEAEDKERTEIIFAKNRSGETGTNVFKFESATTKFTEIDFNA